MKKENVIEIVLYLILAVSWLICGIVNISTGKIISSAIDFFTSGFLFASVIALYFVAKEK